MQPVCTGERPAFLYNKKGKVILIQEWLFDKWEKVLMDYSGMPVCRIFYRQ